MVWTTTKSLQVAPASTLPHFQPNSQQQMGRWALLPCESEHITPPLKTFHYLPLLLRLKAKVLTLMWSLLSWATQDSHQQSLPRGAVVSLVENLKLLYL